MFKAVGRLGWSKVARTSVEQKEALTSVESKEARTRVESKETLTSVRKVSVGASDLVRNEIVLN